MATPIPFTNMTIQRIVLCIIVCFVFFFEGSAQTNFVTHNGKDKSLYQLEWRLDSGNSRYLRDIATFLDKTEEKEYALKILRQKTIFPSIQIALNEATTKDEFFDFFYTHHKEIKYSHILQIYYTVPLEQISKEIDTEDLSSISPMDAFSKLCLDLQHSTDIKKIRQKIIALRDIQIHKGVPLNKLITCIDLSDPIVQDVMLSSNAIEYFTAKEDLKESFQQVIDESASNPEFVNKIYSRIFGLPDSNLSISEIQSSFNRFNRRKMTLKDSIDHKIESDYKVSNKYYYNDVDFYGTTLCTKLKSQEENNILVANLLATKDPKLLFYLAAYIFSDKKAELNNDIIQLLENLTTIKITGANNYELAQNILIYWAQNYNSYTWDESIWRFVSEEEKKKQTKNLERLIRRLNSTNDTVALNAYVSLSEANPFEVSNLVDKYKKVMKKTNPLIPPLKYNYLETTTKLVAYNREFDISYQPSLPITKLLAKLDVNTPNKERIEIENKIIAIAEVKDIPALEYWGTINIINKPNSFSIGRIIELVLAKYWHKMKLDRQWLTHFIYKAALFNELDGTGIAKSYSKLLKVDDPELEASIEYIKIHSSRQEVMDYIQDEIFNDEDTEDSNKQKAIAAKEDLVTKLRKATEITYSQINQLLDFEESLTTEKAQTLSFIEKLMPKKDIRKLKIKGELTSEDLSFLKGEAYSHREIGSILRFFNSENPKENLKFALESIHSFNIDDKAYVVNTLFRYRWFTQYINESKFISQEMIQLISILSQYLKESEFIGEIEDRTTQINIIQTSFIGRDIEEQLIASIELDVDLALKADLQKVILAKAKFEDLGIILDHVDGLINNKGNLDLSFLNEDFGLPIFDISTNAELRTFLERHKTLSKKSFYMIYLEDFGIDFKTKGGKLDYEKIVKILKYDIAEPFIGRGGGKRDFYVYGLTKVLEEEFKDDLGFEDKLNNYQTFVHFSGLQRARAWYNYLTSLGFGKRIIDSPSF